MLYDPAWEKGKVIAETKSKKISLMEMIGKLKPRNGSNGKDSGLNIFKKAKQA